MAPVTLRAVASGLMIENVRSIAIRSSFVALRKREAYESAAEAA
jgi:hypothetical protein